MRDIVAMDDRKFREEASSKRMPAHRRENRTNAVDIYDRNDDVHVRVSLSGFSLGSLGSAAEWDGARNTSDFLPRADLSGKRRIQKAAVDSTEYLLDRPGPSEKTPGPRS